MRFNLDNLEIKLLETIKIATKINDLKVCGKQCEV